MRQSLARFILRLFGWQLHVQLPEEKKFVVIGAPHTSNWDLPLALLCIWAVGKRPTWVMKKEVFVGPLGWLFRALGGLPVDRSTPGGLIKQIASLFDQREEMIFGITPEGTRSRTDHWKTGFYHIAREAGVPVMLGYVDYQRRRVGFEKKLCVDEDIDTVFSELRDYYREFAGRFPEKQGPVRPGKKPPSPD